jgi:hypothetical protein
MKKNVIMNGIYKQESDEKRKIGDERGKKKHEK